MQPFLTINGNWGEKGGPENLLDTQGDITQRPCNGEKPKSQSNYSKLF